VGAYSCPSHVEFQELVDLPIETVNQKWQKDRFFRAGFRGFVFAQEVTMYYYVHATFLNKTGAFELPLTRKEEISYEKL